jgi:hypothetical protein
MVAPATVSGPPLTVSVARRSSMSVKPVSWSRDDRFSGLGLRVTTAQPPKWRLRKVSLAASPSGGLAPAVRIVVAKRSPRC